MINRGKYYIGIVLLFAFLLVGCNTSSNNVDNQMTVAQMRELYGESSEYNANTTKIELTDVVIDSNNTTFKFTFTSNRNLSEFFNMGFYNREYKAQIAIRDDQDMTVYSSELFTVDVGDGNNPFNWSIDNNNDVAHLFQSSDIVYITLQILNSDNLIFTEYNFVGSGNNF